MKFLTSDDIFENILDLVRQSKEEIKIASAWITQSDYFRMIIEEIKHKDISMEVIIRAHEIKDFKITDESVFKLIKSTNSKNKLFISNRLHAKFIIVDKAKAIVGSANFTTHGLSDINTGNIEAGSLYREESEKEEVKKLYDYFECIKSQYSFEIKDELIGFALNPTKTDSFEFVAINPDIKEQSYVEVIYDNSTILGKIIYINAYDVGFFTNPFSNAQFKIFPPFEYFKTIFSGNKHQDWKKFASFAYLTQKDGTIKIATCEIIGQIEGDKIKRLRKPFDVGEAVYLASEEKLKSLMKTNLNNHKMKTPVIVGKKEGTDIDVYIDLDEVVSKHMSVIGITGSGKSFFVKRFLCDILKLDKTLKVFIFDPHGEYYEKLKDRIEENIFHKEFNDFILPVDYDDVKKLIEHLGYANLLNKNSNAGKKFYSDIHKYIKPSLQTTKLKELGMIDIIKKIKEDLGKADEANNDKTKNDTTKQLIEDLEDIYKKAINIQPEELKSLDKLEQREERVFIFNLKNIIDSDSRINLAGLIMQEIFNKSKEDKQKRIIVLDEAHNFAPEKGYGDASSGKDNISLVIASKIASEGRKFNLGLIAITQRPAQITKYVLSQMNTQVIFRIINSLDLEAVQKYVEYISADTVNLLPKFNTGTCIVCGISVPMPMIVEIPNDDDKA